MDITIKDRILDGLKVFMAEMPLQTGLTLAIVGKAPFSPTYPLLKFTEARNVTMPIGYNRRQRIASLGFRLDVYMSSDEIYDKEDVVRNVIFYANQYLTEVTGLRCMSVNYFDEEPYRGQAMYSCDYFENKQIIY